MASPLYPQGPISATATLETANTNVVTPGSGTVVTIYTGTASGKDEIDCAIIAATAAVTAGMIRLWLYDGSIYQLIAEVPVPPWTPVNTHPQTPLWKATVTFKDADGEPKPIRLPSASYSIRGTTHVSETFRVTLQGITYA